MKSQKKNEIAKTILVISDTHLGAGKNVNGRRNYLEDFHYDRELIEFLNYYSSGEYDDRKVELVINGDFFDLLAVPFVPYFDDEFFSEEASLAKLDQILYAHQEIAEALASFLEKENKAITYIIGNHDAEMIFPSMQLRVKALFSKDIGDRFTFISTEQGEYSPFPRVLIKHGHQIEAANSSSEYSHVIKGEDGRLFLIPPWGSYFVTRVLNKFKQERSYANTVRPIKHFIVYGLLHDTIFTLRFISATLFYFFMIRILFLFKTRDGFKAFFQLLKEDMKLFLDHDGLAESLLQTHPGVKILIIGHTHRPEFHSHIDGSIFINTGTWIKMHNLDLGRRREATLLTYAKMDIFVPENNSQKQRMMDQLDVNLLTWKGSSDRPYGLFT